MDAPSPRRQDRIRRTNPPEKAGLAELITGGRYAEAVRQSMPIYGISLSDGFSPVFVRDMYPYPDDAITLPERRVVLITANAFLSPGWLARTLFHESIHVEQYFRGDWGAPDSLGESVNEVEAYDRTRKVAAILGLSPPEIEVDEGLRQSYYRKLDASYRFRILGAAISSALRRAILGRFAWAIKARQRRR